MNYMIAWRREWGDNAITVTYFHSADINQLTHTRYMGEAWVCRDKKYANRMCRKLIEGWESARFAHVIEVTDKELFEARLKGE